MNGRKITYKQLIVAAGLQVQTHKIKNLDRALGRAGVTTNYVYPFAQRTWDFVRLFPGGNAIFTQPQGVIKCAGAPQKAMYLAQEHWQKYVGEGHYKIDFVSGQPTLFGVPHYAKTLTAHCANKGINTTFGLNLVEVRPETKEAVFERVLPSADGAVGDRVVKPYTFLHVTPPQGPHPFIAQSALADDNGWLEVDKETLQHKRFPNVFGVGDCCNLPTSRTAAAAVEQAHTVAENVYRYRESRPAHSWARYDGYTACPFLLGRHKGMIAEFDYSGQPKETFWMDQSKPSYFQALIKKEELPNFYWEKATKGKNNMENSRINFAILRILSRKDPRKPWEYNEYR